MKVVFVCTANTCRSPMLESMFAHYLKQNDIGWIEVSSAGIYAKAEPINVHTKSVLLKHAIPFINKKSVKVDDVIELCDIVFTMTTAQRDMLLPKVKNAKIYSLSTLAGHDIADPFGKGERAYEDTYQMFDDLLEKILYVIKQAYQAGI